MVGAGAVVTRDVPPNAIVIGNPAYITGYVSAQSKKETSKLQLNEQQLIRVVESTVKGVKIYNLPLVTDMRGSLSFAEYGQYLPFIPKRYFLVFDVTSKEVRGEHAHKTLQQFLVCIKGSCSLVVEDGVNAEEIVLDRPNIGVYLPPMVWGIQYKYSLDAVLMVLASASYDASDYIRDYEEYTQIINKI
jgi:dTDP-4-dehydrorhamnose 3,5-epimerase-like enzyme